MKTRSSLPYLLALAFWLGLPLSSRAANVVVTSLADSGPGSLRAAVAFAGTNDGGAVITFDPALDGQVIFTANEIMLTNQVTIDASELTNGITISGTDASSVLTFEDLVASHLPSGLRRSGGIGQSYDPRRVRLLPGANQC